ncbi:MAG: hypothetical protein LUE21_11895 [Oscillospiraceae bacterium]|nr:hypothetical protein [Oscillospiraceae bacterium]
MDKKVILLSGMPAAGKDTVTELLCRRDSRYTAFKKYRSTDGDTPLKDTYYNISKEAFRAKIEAGELLQFHCRYGRYYGIGRAELAAKLEQGRIPIIHIGRLENYYAFRQAAASLRQDTESEYALLHILLWAPLDILEERLIRREKSAAEVARRMAAAREELEDNRKWLSGGACPYTAIIKNLDADATCRRIMGMADGTEAPSEAERREFIRYAEGS